MVNGRPMSKLKVSIAGIWKFFLKYPPLLANKEYELRELIKSKIRRGKLNVSIQIKKNGFEDEAVSLDESRLKNYLSSH
jgi:uncharacterized protein YicC (UPF0701 family)